LQVVAACTRPGAARRPSAGPARRLDPPGRPAPHRTRIGPPGLPCAGSIGSARGIARQVGPFDVLEEIPHAFGLRRFDCGFAFRRHPAGCAPPVHGELVDGRPGRARVARRNAQARALGIAAPWQAADPSPAAARAPSRPRADARACASGGWPATRCPDGC